MRASAGAAFLATTFLSAGPLRAGDTALLDRANAWQPGEGDFVLTANNRCAINRSAEVPDAHVRPLLVARQGDALILHNEAKRRLDFYHVRGVYEPPVP